MTNDSNLKVTLTLTATWEDAWENVLLFKGRAPKINITGNSF